MDTPPSSSRKRSHTKHMDGALAPQEDNKSRRTSPSPLITDPTTPSTSSAYVFLLLSQDFLDLFLFHCNRCLSRCLRSSPPSPIDSRVILFFPSDAEVSPLHIYSHFVSLFSVPTSSGLSFHVDVSPFICNCSSIPAQKCLLSSDIHLQALLYRSCCYPILKYRWSLTLFIMFFINVVGLKLTFNLL